MRFWGGAQGIVDGDDASDSKSTASILRLRFEAEDPIGDGGGLPADEEPLLTTTMRGVGHREVLGDADTDDEESAGDDGEPSPDKELLPLLTITMRRVGRREVPDDVEPDVDESVCDNGKLSPGEEVLLTMTIRGVAGCEVVA